MRLRFLLVALIVVIGAMGTGLYSVSWSYDFGTGTGSLTGANTSTTSTNAAPVTTLFKATPPAGGGTFRGFVGSGGGGLYSDDPGLAAFGTNTELRIAAASTVDTTQINKFAISDYTTNTRGYFRSQFRIGSSNGGNADSGTFFLFLGNGTSFSSNAQIAGNNEAFLGMKWVLGTSGTIATYWMVDNSWYLASSQTGWSGFTFSQGQTYVLEFFFNNGNGHSHEEYTYNGTSQTSISPTADVWINGVRIGDDMANAWTTAWNNDIDSYAFYGKSSTGNVANLFLDNMSYNNDWATGFVPIYTEFYSKSTGVLNTLANWGSNPDGTGVAPTNFTTAGQTFYIQNNAAPTIGANWTVSGTGTKVILGNGTNTCTFTVPTAYTATATIDVNNAGVLNIQRMTSYPTFGTLFPGSTIRYSGADAQPITTTTYSNLSIQGTGTKTLAGSVTVSSITDVGDGTNAVTFTIPAAYTLTSTVNVRNAGILNIANTTLPTIGTLDSGSTVRYSATSSQSVAGAAYSILQIYGGGTKTLTGTASAGNNTTVGDGSNIVTLSVPAAYGLTGTTNVLGGNTLILTSTTIPTMGTLGADSVVRYDAPNAQNIAGGSYSILQVYGTGIKPLIGAASAGVSTTVGDGTNIVTLTVPSTYALTGTTNVGASSTLRLENTTIPTLGTLGTNSIVIYAAPGNQNVAGAAYQYLQILGTGIKTLIGATSAVYTTTISDGTNIVTLLIPSTYAFTGTINVAANGTLNIENATLPTIGTLASGSTVRYGYTGNQNVTGTTYYNLDIANGADKTMLNDVTVTNLTFNTGTLALNSYNLYLAGKFISFYSTNAIFSALSAAYTDAYVGGEGVGRIWTTDGSFTNSVAATFTFPAGTAPTSLYLWYKGDGGVWTKGAAVTHNFWGGLVTITVSGLTSLSGTGAKGSMEWTFAESDETLPVELSSFTAMISSANYVQLTWITQSETNVAGFRIYRNTTDDLASAEMLNTFINATNTSQTQVYVYTDEEIQGDGTYYYWLQNLDLDGSFTFHGPTMVTITGHEQGIPPVPVVMGINNAWPNPFNPSLTIKYGLTKRGNAALAIYNQRGQLVRNLYSGTREIGSYNQVWDGRDNSGRDLPSGVYFIRLEASGKTFGHKVVLLK